MYRQSHTNAAKTAAPPAINSPHVIQSTRRGSRNKPQMPPATRVDRDDRWRQHRPHPRHRNQEQQIPRHEGSRPSKQHSERRVEAQIPRAEYDGKCRQPSGESARGCRRDGRQHHDGGGFADHFGFNDRKMRAQLAGFDQWKQVVGQSGGRAHRPVYCAQIHHYRAFDIAESNPEQNERKNGPSNRILLMTAGAMTTAAAQAGTAAAEDPAAGAARRTADSRETGTGRTAACRESAPRDRSRG